MAMAIADIWLKSVLTDAALLVLAPGGAHNGGAPKGTVGRFVVFSHQAGHDVMGTGTARIMTTLNYLVKVVSQDQSAVAGDAALARVDALLHGGKGAVTGGWVLSCVRLTTVGYGTIENGIS